MNSLLLRQPSLHLPYYLDFSTLPNGRVPRWLGSAQAMGGAASVAPELGAELLTNGNMEAGDPPSNWDAVTATIDGVADERTGGAGAQSLSIARNEANYPEVRQVIATVLGTWYSLSVWFRKVDAATGQIGLADASTNADWAVSGWSSSGAWTQLRAIGRALDTDGKVRLRGSAVGLADGVSVRFDDASVLPLSLPSLLSGPALCPNRSDVRLLAAWTRVTGAQFGVALVDDPENPTAGIVAYHDGANAHLDKFTAPTAWTSLVSAAAAYGDGRAVELRRKGTDCEVWYHGAQVGATQTVSDAVVLSARYAVLFSTSAGNTCSSMSVEAL